MRATYGTLPPPSGWSSICFVTMLDGVLPPAAPALQGIQEATMRTWYDAPPVQPPRGPEERPRPLGDANQELHRGSPQAPRGSRSAGPRQPPQWVGAAWQWFMLVM